MNGIKSIPSQLLVSVNTYSAIITNKMPIMDYLKASNLYYGLAIRSITSIEDNHALVYDVEGKFIEDVKFYDM